MTTPTTPRPRAHKPLGHRSYGSIGHLPGSRQGRDDVGIGGGQARICTVRARDRHDTIIVQEKADGSNVAIANIDGVLVPLIRAGYHARDGRFEQHQLFAEWVYADLARFDFLEPGERVCGEWLAQAHGTRYADRDDDNVFIAFDIMRSGHERATLDELQSRAGDRLELARTLHVGAALAVEIAMAMLSRRDADDRYGFHGALDPVEGAVWRVERRGKVDFLAKWVRPDKVDGCFLPEVSGQAAVWNWRPR